MTKRKTIILVGLTAIIAGAIAFLTPFIAGRLRWRNAVEAASSFPYQIGLTDVIIINCFTTGVPPVCTGGTLCNMKDAATCATYSDVSGTPAGGMGSNALFLNTAIAQAGLTAGGQLIAGGMSSVLMDSGVLASSGGCYGCGQ